MTWFDPDGVTDVYTDAPASDLTVTLDNLVGRESRLQAVEKARNLARNAKHPVVLSLSWFESDPRFSGEIDDPAERTVFEIFRYSPDGELRTYDRDEGRSPR